LRLDEFSAPADIDGEFTTQERTRFLSFGFDITMYVSAAGYRPYLFVVVMRKEARRRNGGNTG
jgi:hypothetical protein